MNIENFKAVILDFDGVVVDSSELKHNLFLKVAGECAPGLVEPLDAALNTALSGAERKRVAQWLAARCSKPEIEPYFLDRFTSLLGPRWSELPLLPGIRTFVEKLEQLRIPVAILSAAPTDDIRSLLQKHEIEGFFYRVYGSSDGTKKKSAQELVSALGIFPWEVLYFGDMPSDLLLAQELSLHFVRIESFAGMRAEWPHVQIPTQQDFRGNDASR